MRINQPSSARRRNIRLTGEAYRVLKSRRLKGETFSQAIMRLAGRGRSLAELSTVMPRKAANAVAAAVKKSRDERLGRKKRDLGLS